MSDILRNARQGGGQDGQGPSASAGTVTLYANGFIFGEGGEFRESSDPKNAAFIEALKRGEVPQELEVEARQKWGAQASQIGISLVDKTSETHAVKFNFAKSQGMSLGGSNAAPAQDLASLQPAEYKVDGNSPATAIQLVLKDKKKVRVQINEGAPVSALYAHTMFLTNERTFSLAGGFPPKVVQCGGTTIKEAGWSGASVHVR